jgi:hypothetical protein
MHMHVHTLSASATGQAFLIVCPRASEAPAVYELLTSLAPGKRVVLMNPELINAEVVGFGMGACVACVCGDGGGGWLCVVGDVLYVV